MFQSGNPVELRYRVGDGEIALQGSLQRVHLPLLEVHLVEHALAAALASPGKNVVVHVTGGMGVYTSEAVVQRYDAQNQQVYLLVKDAFRYQQRRQYERFPCKLPVKLRVVGDEQWTNGEVRDISIGGARVHVTQELQLRSNTIELILTSPIDRQLIHIVADIVRVLHNVDEVGDWELGVRFVEMGRMDKIHFMRLLQFYMEGQQSLSVST